MSNSTQTMFASASSPSSADELLGKLAAYRPIEIREIETKLGTSEATITQIVEITEAGDPLDLGERPVFWQVVRRQLATATDAVPWETFAWLTELLAAPASVPPEES